MGSTWSFAERWSDDERRLGLASEVAAIGFAALLLLSAALPNALPVSRAGLVLAAGLLVAFTGLWFHALPAPLLGPMRFVVGIAIVQGIAALLLALTGGIGTLYFAYFLLPILATAFAMRVEATVVTGAVAVSAFVTLAVLDVFGPSRSRVTVDLALERLLLLVAVIVMTALIARVQEARRVLRAQADQLSAQNLELDVARRTALALARSRKRDEITRAIFDAAAEALQIDRIFLFLGGNDDLSSGYTLAAGGAVEEFRADPSFVDSSRQRAARERRTVVVSDASRENGPQRERDGVAAAIYVPLIHLGETIGVVAFSSGRPREWSETDVRLAEVIAEVSAAASASYLAFERVRVASQELAKRTRVLEGLNRLVDALTISRDEEEQARAAARNLVQSFRLRGVTTLLADPSLALLEARGSAGEPSRHPVVHGLASCPAIKGGRLFRVDSPDAPVVCPHMPFREGTPGYACVPLSAGGETVGALFMESQEGSVVEEALARAAADRLALTVANERALKVAQRQATTDGLTGLYNRHFLEEQLRIVQSLAERHGQPYSAVAMDLDRLKPLNDTFGHEMGDLALRGFAGVLRRLVRGSDIPVRTGGDEFLLLLPQTALPDGAAAAERVRRAVRQRGTADPAAAITVSAGVAAWRPGRSAEDVLQAADAMLYQAKRSGRDRVLAEPAGHPVSAA
jgi:diguanylate cyclase (GGDEF)-like protein